MTISIIACMSKNNVIGINGKLPWHIPKDLKRFKELTLGKDIVMGRKTHESIGKPLKDRTNIVISETSRNIVGCEVFKDLEAIITMALNVEDEIFFIGGQRIFEAVLPFADKMYLTIVNEVIEGDVKFPPYHTASHCDWVVKKIEVVYKDESVSNLEYMFIDFIRPKIKLV